MFDHLSLESTGREVQYSRDRLQELQEEVEDRYNRRMKDRNNQRRPLGEDSAPPAKKES